MKKNRVDCINCAEFIPPEFKEPINLISIIRVSAKCRLGKRIAFRYFEEPCKLDGWLRYCGEFNGRIKEDE